LVIILAVGLFVGVSFSSVYAGVLINTDDIADNAITSDKIKNKQVKSKDIKNNAIKTKHIRDGTITSADLAPGVADDQYVPFLKTTSTKKTCDTPGGGLGVATYSLTSAKGKTFMVTSFVIIPGGSSVDQAADSIKIISIGLGGVSPSISSDDLTGLDTGQRGIEVLGASASKFNTKVPLQLANVPGFALTFLFRCDASTTNNLEIIEVLAVGLKAADDTISIT